MRARFILMTWLMLVMASIFIAPPAQAQKISVPATLIAETETPAAGQQVTLAILFRPEPTWHGYWINPGDAGQGLRLEWMLPDGVTAGEPRFPVPETLIIGGLMNHVYEHDHAVLVDLNIPVNMAPGTRMPVRVNAEWLGCTDKICVPQSGELVLELTVGDGRVDPATRTQFDGWRGAIPQLLDQKGRYAVSGETVRIAIPYPAAAPLAEPHVFLKSDGVIDYAAPQRFFRQGDSLIMESKAGFDPSAAGTIELLLKTGPDKGLMVTAERGTVPSGGEPLAAMGEAPEQGFAAIMLALGGALLGGLLLNILPCVFPILSLKALALAKASGDERAARRDAVAYSVGAILTCLALGGMLLALRAGGASVGWAFQLQDVRVIALLFLLTAAITLNLAGWFGLGAVGMGQSLAEKQGWAGSFWTGALAAFVATPCTGPFMAAALGAALVLPTSVALAIFAGLGIGLALPFLMIGFIPAIRKRLPKPGPWMERFRRWMAIPMALTALALAWVLWRQAGWPGLGWAVLAAALMTLALRWASRAQAQGKSLWLPLIPAVLVAIAACGTLPLVAPPVKRAVESPLPAQPFSEAKLEELRKAGKPVFVYFTADWCVTCKVNERGALASDDVADHFSDKEIAVLVGDWTNGDATMGRFIERFNRAGVPLYLYYPAKGEPRVLPQLLIEAELLGL